SLSERLFWDIDPSQLDEHRHRVYVIERVLEYGREEDARWLFRRYDRAAITEVVRESRRLSRKSPRMIRPTAWEEVKAFFLEGAKNIG
ncbi:MAG: hypothetical protein A3C92_02790, partial [Candidatus Sungbacteria bacterium RIFCSPHIGHO2_02_FULL_53_17]